MKKYLYTVPLLGVYLFFCYLMLGITWQYIPYNTDAAFLRIKQDVIGLGYYRLAFFTHVYTSMFVLLAAFTQFSTTILQKKPQIHRISGKIYVFVVVFLAGPSGLVMGFYANGGFWSQLAFCILAILWVIFTAMAYIKAKNKQFEAHKRYMYRSFALTLSAITLRAWKYVLVALFQPAPMDVYRWVAWLGWVVNLLVAELIILNWKRIKENISDTI